MVDEGLASENDNGRRLPSIGLGVDGRSLGLMLLGGERRLEEVYIHRRMSSIPEHETTVSKSP